MAPRLARAVLLVGILGCAISPASAAAAGTLQFIDFGDGTSQVVFAAGLSDVNNVVVSGTRDQVTITSAFPIAVAAGSSPPCSGDGTTIVVCAGTGISLDATLGNLPDRIEITADILTRVGGGEGSDTLIGGPGQDSLTGDDDVDTISGNGGADFLAGGSGDESGDGLSGGPGADSFSLATSDGPDLLDGGPGIDHVRTATGFLLSGFSYTLDDRLPNDGFTNQRANIVGIEDITAHESHDVVRGTGGPNVIVTLDGDDVVDGLSGADLISLGRHRRGARRLQRPDPLQQRQRHRGRGSARRAVGLRERRDDVRRAVRHPASAAAGDRTPAPAAATPACAAAARCHGPGVRRFDGEDDPRSRPRHHGDDEVQRAELAARDAHRAAVRPCRRRACRRRDACRANPSRSKDCTARAEVATAPVPAAHSAQAARRAGPSSDDHAARAGDRCSRQPLHAEQDDPAATLLTAG